MSVTLRDVALASGVSASAVSQVLRSHHSCRVSAPVRARIRAAAARLGYRPNHLSTSLRWQRSGLLSLILPWNNPELMEVMEQAAYHLGYRLLTNFLTHPDLDREVSLVNDSLDWQIEGLFWLPHSDLSFYPASLLTRLSQHKARLVFMQRRLAGVAGGLVGMNYRQGMADVAAHAAEQGYTQVIFLAFDIDFEIRSLRKQYLQEECAARGLSCKVILTKAKQHNVLEALQVELADAPQRPTLIFCDSDSLSLFTLRALQVLGVKTPEQVGIISNGDQLLLGFFRLGSVIEPQLTALTANYTLQAEQSMKMMSNLLQDENLEPQEVLLPMKLQCRQSTARIGHDNTKV